MRVRNENEGTIFKINRLLLMFGVVTMFVMALGWGTALAQERSAASSASPAFDEWKSYAVKGEEFSVSLPVVPAMSTQTVRVLKLNKDREQRIIGAYADGVVFAIYSFENPGRRQSIADVIAESNEGSEDSTPHDLTLGGFKGKEYSFQSADRKGVTQFYITERHVYRFVAVGSTLGNPDAAIAKFILSIRLEKKPIGIEVLDGAGEQPSSTPSVTPENSEAQVRSGKDVSRKAIVITKPEPQYTEAARHNQVTGTVVIRCVFSSHGAVVSLHPVSGLPFGLTERALAAARQIKFIPAIKEGHFVSMYIQLEYNFNLY
jgi:TonB family protein